MNVARLFPIIKKQCVGQFGVLVNEAHGPYVELDIPKDKEIAFFTPSGVICYDKSSQVEVPVFRFLGDPPEGFEIEILVAEGEFKGYRGFYFLFSGEIH